MSSGSLNRSKSLNWNRSDVRRICKSRPYSTVRRSHTLSFGSDHGSGSPLLSSSCGRRSVDELVGGRGLRLLHRALSLSGEVQQLPPVHQRSGSPLLNHVISATAAAAPTTCSSTGSTPNTPKKDWPEYSPG